MPDKVLKREHRSTQIKSTMNRSWAMPKDLAEAYPVDVTEDYGSILERLRNSVYREKPRPIEYRSKQLKALLKMLNDHENDIADAMMEDFNKPRYETIVTEVEFVRNDIRGMLQNIRKWAKPKKVESPLTFIMDSCLIQPEPLGVVLVIGAWNYPINLSFSPMVGAMAAGNCVLLKPSEGCPAVAALLEKIIPRYLDQDCYAVVNGGIEETTELLKERFDYIFYTGSPGVGKIIREAANKFLTPVTLELGGKSPLYIDDSVNMMIAARRALWGKLVNSGQTCVAPDYVLCTAKTQTLFLEAVQKVLKEFYSDNAQASGSYCRILNDRHFQRLTKYLRSGTAVIGGKMDLADKYIEPTVLINVKPSDPVMQEEIFGPILPIVTVSGPVEAVDFIKMREKPLSLYLFTKKKEIIRLFQNHTSSGSMCVNDTVVHLTADSLPFGGVGNSGMGRYHGEFSFECFSHMKSILIRDYNPVAEALGSVRYPPYTDGKLSVMTFFMKKRGNLVPNGFSYLVVFALGFFFAVVVKYIMDNIVPMFQDLPEV